jgi:transcriptional regulator with XRE-family HTH domain
LQELREAVPITKYGLAQKSGITREMIGRLEADEVKKPGAWMLAQIADGLGLPLWKLLRRLEDVAAGRRSRKRQR